MRVGSSVQELQSIQTSVKEKVIIDRAAKLPLARHSLICINHIVNFQNAANRLGSKRHSTGANQ